MRTYNGGQRAAHGKRKMSRRGKSILAVCTSVALVAVALTLALTLGLRGKAPANNDVQDVVTPPPVVDELTFGAPLGACTLKKQASVNRLVYNDTLKQWRAHPGVDLEAAAGSDVMAIAEGKVTGVENTILEGVVVTVTHRDGYVSVYKGLDTASVAVNDSVAAGGVLGKLGVMLCEKNSGPHLHLEMKKDGKYVAATDYIDLDSDK